MLVRSGSHLYGCAIPTSDVDYRGFVIEPAEYLLRRKSFEQYEDKESDVVIWGVAKFFELLEKGSPNTVEILFAPEKSYEVLTVTGDEVLNYKHLFVSKNLTNAIRGFASGEWLKAQLLSKNKETGEISHRPSVVGAKRKESHAEFGYSVKNAYHTIRLLEQGIELLKNHTITFPRPNADLLRSIRNGEVPFEDLSKIRDERIAEFASEEEKTTLRESVNKEEIDKLFFRVIHDKLSDFTKSNWTVKNCYAERK